MECSLFEDIKSQYFNSEVTSGEFIYSLKFPAKKYKTKDVRKAIDNFLKWDESKEEYKLILLNNNIEVIEF